MSPLLTSPQMYPREVTLKGETRHSRYCQAMFARRDWKCHRCCELLRNAAPRTGWQKKYFEQKVGRRRFLW